MANQWKVTPNSFVHCASYSWCSIPMHVLKYTYLRLLICTLKSDHSKMVDKIAYERQNTILAICVVCIIMWLNHQHGFAKIRMTPTYWCDAYEHNCFVKPYQLSHNLVSFIRTWPVMHNKWNENIFLNTKTKNDDVKSNRWIFFDCMQFHSHRQIRLCRRWNRALFIHN